MLEYSISTASAEHGCQSSSSTHTDAHVDGNGGINVTHREKGKNSSKVNRNY